MSRFIATLLLVLLCGSAVLIIQFYFTGYLEDIFKLIGGVA